VTTREGIARAAWALFHMHGKSISVIAEMIEHSQKDTRVLLEEGILYRLKDLDKMQRKAHAVPERLRKFCGRELVDW
jgi:hypothetical protein